MSRRRGDWLQEADLNRRPLGYEPSELPLLYPARILFAGIPPDRRETARAAETFKRRNA